MSARCGPLNGHRGFTLLELLISITLMAVVVAIAAMAFRTGVSSYKKRLSFNQGLLPLEALVSLMDRQLRGVPRVDDPALKAFLRFEGDSREMLFVTTASPLGAGQGGMVLALYRFLEADGLLIYAQKVVVRQEDARSEPPSVIRPDDRDELLEKGWLCDFLPVESVKFSYMSGRETDGRVVIFGDGQMSDHFKFTTTYPVAVRISLKGKGGRELAHDFFL